MHLHAAGLGAYANMRFPQWAFSHRPCARSGRTRSKSSWWRLTGPTGRGFQNWCSSRQPLLGKFLWGGIYFLREGAPSGTRAQTCGISTYGPWTGRGGSKWATSSGSKHYRFCQGSVYETSLQAEVEPVHRLVFSPPGGPPARRCPIAVVLSFLQDGLERRLSPSTLKVYVAAIAAHHDAVDGKSLGKHDLVIRFLRGARRLNPPRPHLVPSWDLPSVLSALRGAPFEPLQSVELKFLSLKTVLLSALATVKRVGDLQAFSVDDSCLEFGPADSHVVLRPRPGYVPKVPTMPFRDQVVNLQALPREEADPAIALLCPVRALRIYVDRTQSFRTSDQLFVCFGGQQKGRAVSKQRLAHWIVEAIVLAYQARRLPCPLGVRAHSTRGVASSWALARGASIADICKAAGWATPNTFARFYNLRIEPVSSRVLVSDGQ